MQVPASVTPLASGSEKAGVVFGAARPGGDWPVIAQSKPRYTHGPHATHLRKPVDTSDDAVKQKGTLKCP